MCGGFPIQKGIPLNEETLSQMTEEEQVFWEDFLSEADRTIEEKEKKGENRPFTPPVSLNAKYQEAITKYNGEQYCQIQ